MATITKMTHKSVTAEFSMEEWERLKMALRRCCSSDNSEQAINESHALLKSISPTPAKSQSPFNDDAG